MRQDDESLAADRIPLPYQGRRIDQIAVDHRLVLKVDQDGELAIEAPGLLSVGPLHGRDASPVRLVPETGDVAPALSLLHTTIVSCVAFNTGALHVVFSSGHHLNVDSSQDYEAWTAAGPGHFKCVSLPGGSLAQWSQN